MSVKKILICVCLLQFFVEGIFAQNNISIKLVSKQDSILQNAFVNVYCNGKFTQYFTNNNGIALVPISKTNCLASIGATGFETIYNIKLDSSKNYTFKLIKKNTALQEVIVTAQNKTILAENSIYNVQTISEKTIQKLAAQTLADAIGFENGMYQQQDNILGSALNIQGIGAQNIKILVNGVPINGRENGTIDLSSINISNAERIEYIKGPMSVMYGTDALGGVINIITKQPKKSISANILAESINKINTNLSLGFTKKRHAISVQGNRNFFGGWQTQDTFNRNLLWRPKLQYMLDANYVYTTSKGKIAYIPTYYTETILSKGTPNVDQFQASAIDEQYNTKRMVHSLQAELNLDTNKKVNVVSSVAWYNRVKNKYSVNMQDLSKQLTRQPGDQDTTTFTDYNTRLTYSNDATKKWTYLVGVETNWQFANSLKLKDRIKSITDLAIFINAPYKITKHFSLQPALRLTHNSQYKAPIIPSINASLQLPHQNILRVSLARGFRAPTLKELYLQFVDVNHNVLGNDSLKAEKSIHAQINWDKNIYSNKQTKIKLNTNIYYNNINNQIALAILNAATNKYKYTNIAKFKNIALEANIKMQSSKVSSSIGFSANNILTANYGKGIYTWDATMQHAIVLNKKQTSLNVFYKFLYKQPLLTLSTYGSDALYNSYLPSMHMADANIAQLFFKNKLNVQVGVRNIFNINSVNIQGATNSAVHSNGTTQSINPARSYYLAMRFSL